MSPIDEMVERVSWFSPVDYEILLFFENHDIEASAKVISANIEYDRQYVSKRLRELADESLLQKNDESGLYELSEHGRDFLAGDLNASDLEGDDE